MTLVVDASVTMAWCFEDEASGATDALLERISVEGCVVPSLWRSEVANVLMVAERRDRITAAQRDRFLALLDQVPVTVESTPPDSAALIWLADKHGLSAYDAWYLWLAARSAATLATVDVRLAAAARSAGVEVVPPATD
ncbi:type II toxin-antitoxin system VapC family toxin [Nocardioides stalactiti]|uniref:type II toxin-antitoxin system VapC family toxin n=1 Tax=Nocardioides stalactiti TaxID=2755356 RepID=UPI001C7F7707|nr:type II toxin-antitoxin system VapC family toxin [Nocardioides stalactiti]